MDTPHSELDLIDWIHNRAAPPSDFVQLGIGDDCAVCRPRPGYDLVVTTDALVEGRHFRFETASPEDVGWRTAASNLSDIAAMGGRPTAFFLAAAFPGEAVGLFQRLMDGLLACLQEFETPLAGGDLSAAERFFLTGSVLGEVPTGEALRRDGARAGDLVAVSGRLGLSGAGLRLLESGWRLDGDRLRPPATPTPAFGAEYPADLIRHCLKRHLRPTPRLALGRLLRECGGVSAAIDVSDGIAKDLRQICRRSGVGAQLDGKALAAMAGPDGFPSAEDVLGGGEDYELLFTVRAEAWERVAATVAATAALPPISPIGRLVEAPAGNLSLLAAGGEHPLPESGFDHFRRRDPGD